MRRILAIMMCLAAGPAAMAQDLAPPPAGNYQLDLGHGRLLFSVNHLGFSNYIALFTDFDADLVFNPDQPETMSVKATIKAASVETHYPDPAVDFNAVIAGPEFLDAEKYPEITFVSTGVALTGENAADLTGDLTLHGVTKPITLAVTYNGGWGRNDMDPTGARIGFSAKGTLKRSEYGMGYGIPAPGTTLGVFDEVAIVIEVEFSNPDAK